jgi:hypothetical protein
MEEYTPPDEGDARLVANLFNASPKAGFWFRLIGAAGVTAIGFGRNSGDGADAHELLRIRFLPRFFQGVGAVGNSTTSSVLSHCWSEIVMQPTSLIENYLAGPQLLQSSVTGLSGDQLMARPIQGKWSCLEVICHLADFEIVYADRIKRVIVEDKPTMFGGDPDAFAARLAYHERDCEEELRLIESIRKQVAQILRILKPEDFQRQGIHSESGPLSLETLVQRITGHIPHHVRFIAEKRNALG